MTTSQSMLRSMVLAMLGMVLVYFAVGGLLADRWQVETTRLLTASPEQVRVLVSDFRSWANWSAMDATLGPQTAREVTGEAGTVGHCMLWSGSQGKATLTLRSATSTAIEYEFHAPVAETGAMALRGTGRIEWSAEAAGCRVRWHDASTWDSLAGRWIGWFGALQERVKQIQGSSLEGLQQAIAGGQKSLNK